jgi:Xaa-Pro aminopeptidase
VTGGANGDLGERESLLRDRLARVGVWLEAHGADALVLRRPENLAWVTGGGDLRVSREGDSVADAVVTAHTLRVITSRIEAPRLQDEILAPGTDLEVVAWHDPTARSAAIDRITRGMRTLSDRDVDLAELRLPLTPLERARFERLGSEAARGVTDTVDALEPGLSEHEVAARVHRTLRALGMELPVVLVAGEERFGRYRHPVVTRAPFGAFGLIVVCAQRHGLIASLSRTVAFGDVPDLLQERLARVLRIEEAMLDATRSGVATNAVLQAARSAYEREGERDAWLDHHQGGPAGYAPREWLATPDETRLLRTGMAVAWNPSLPFAKSEDSFWIEEEGLVNLTWDDRWPSTVVGGRTRALVRAL